MFVRLMSGLKNLNRSIVYINRYECLTNISLKKSKTSRKSKLGSCFVFLGIISLWLVMYPCDIWNAIKI